MTPFLSLFCTLKCPPGCPQRLRLRSYISACSSIMLLLLYLQNGFGQAKRLPMLSLQSADTLHRPRLLVSGGLALTSYSASMYGLWNAWYADYPRARFHYFNDNKEWLQIDKCGHAFSALHEARLVYGTARWAGMTNRQAAWVGFASGQIFQTSFEVMDGFSTEWGFSWGDIGFNVLGGGLWLGQQLHWQEQRITLKMSAWPKRHDPMLIQPIRGVGPPVSLRDRSDELYGTGVVNAYLKNYNTVTYWVSVNPRSFMGERDSWWPRWLNIAAGYGADDMYAGFGYEWQADKNCVGADCLTYAIDPARLPRSRQAYLSLDIDLTRIPVKNRALRIVLNTLNVFKIPAPALAWRQHSGLRFEPIF
jgi:Predicted periplasmic lipoprotein (DUF2279)